MPNFIRYKAVTTKELMNWEGLKQYLDKSPYPGTLKAQKAFLPDLYVDEPEILKALKEFQSGCTNVELAFEIAVHRYLRQDLAKFMPGGWIPAALQMVEGIAYQVGLMGAFVGIGAVAGGIIGTAVCPGLGTAAGAAFGVDLAEFALDVWGYAVLIQQVASDIEVVAPQFVQGVKIAWGGNPDRGATYLAAAMADLLYAILQFLVTMGLMKALELGCKRALERCPKVKELLARRERERKFELRQEIRSWFLKERFRTLPAKHWRIQYYEYLRDADRAEVNYRKLAREGDQEGANDCFAEAVSKRFEANLLERFIKEMHGHRDVVKHAGEVFREELPGLQGLAKKGELELAETLAKKWFNGPGDTMSMDEKMKLAHIAADGIMRLHSGELHFDFHDEGAAGKFNAFVADLMKYPIEPNFDGMEARLKVGDTVEDLLLPREGETLDEALERIRSYPVEERVAMGIELHRRYEMHHQPTRGTFANTLESAIDSFAARLQARGYKDPGKIQDFGFRGSDQEIACQLLARHIYQKIEANLEARGFSRSRNPLVYPQNYATLEGRWSFKW